MREIKFRLWDDDVGYEYWDSLTCPSYSLPELFCQGNILEQYTGLKDKNGKEIYEGDICYMYPRYGCVWGERIGYIKYDIASFWFGFENCAIVLDDHDASFEIIGNIHENKELLK